MAQPRNTLYMVSAPGTAQTLGTFLPLDIFLLDDKKVLIEFYHRRRVYCHK
ncbi:hypothetical protein [Mesorhizobium kowhaii]|uniref:hypothetical protein n=1 Tax=Mesorhizobium kowhaii TaxID=1300272 RepID=UPI00142E86B4|nr:hypothetical protein [Mesorhizobium kowhaii]